MSSYGLNSLPKNPVVHSFDRDLQLIITAGLRVEDDSVLFDRMIKISHGLNYKRDDKFHKFDI